VISFPEVDKAEWMSPEIAREKLVPAQVAFIDRLLNALEGR
jgi:predicted NUDIX family NTP pyrophosphohydrolase